MRLKELHMKRFEPWQNKGEGFEGVLKMASPVSEVTVKLDNQTCQAILLLAAGGIKTAAAATAQLVINDVKTLQLERAA